MTRMLRWKHGGLLFCLVFFFFGITSIQEEITEELWGEREKTRELQLAVVISDFPPFWRKLVPRHGTLQQPNSVPDTPTLAFPGISWLKTLRKN